MSQPGFRLIVLALGGGLIAACGTTVAPLDGRAGADSQLPGERGSVTDALACARRVLQGQVTNARDVGGHPLLEGKVTVCGSFFRGGDLNGLDTAGCSELTKLGIKTVVDLRDPDVQQSQPPPACVNAQAARVLAPMPKLLPDTPENYLALFKETAAVAKVFSVLGEAGSYPVYAHCIIGRDRASFITALVLLSLGASRETVLGEFQLSAEAGVTVKPECIQATLDEVDRRGGIEAYLTSAGVTASQLGALRDQLRR